MQINLMEIFFEYRCKQQILSSLEQSFARISFYLKFYWIYQSVLGFSSIDELHFFYFYPLKISLLFNIV